MGWPSMAIVPLVASKNRGKRLINVDLPAPLGPTSAIVCPAPAVKLIPSSAAIASLS